MKNKAEQKQRSFETSKDYLLAHRLLFIIFLSVILAAELFMTARSLKKPDFPNFVWYRVTYFTSYVTLLIATATVLTLLIIGLKTGKGFRLLVRLMQEYSGLIILWSALISFLDVHNDNTMIVFLTVIICVAAVMNVNPILYTALTSPLCVALIVLAYRNGSELVQSGGYLINFIVFVAFSIMLAFFQYHMNAKSYQAKIQLERLSFFDQLTGAYNRHSLKKHMEEMPSGTIFYFGIIDVDNFKNVNDTFGHDVGDECLITIANLLRDGFGDRIYRYGGDEFVIITNHRETDLLYNIGSINRHLGEAYPEKGIHISAGFYCPMSNSEKYHDIFKKADTALYFAKNTGKSKALVYHEDMEEKADVIRSDS